MKNGAPKRLKPKSQIARLMVMSSGGLSFFFFLQENNSTVPFPSTDMTPAEGQKRTYSSRSWRMSLCLSYRSNLVFKSYKYQLCMIGADGFRMDFFSLCHTNQLLSVHPLTLLHGEQINSHKAWSKLTSLTVRGENIFICNAIDSLCKPEKVRFKIQRLPHRKELNPSGLYSAFNEALLVFVLSKETKRQPPSWVNNMKSATQHI